MNIKSISEIIDSVTLNEKKYYVNIDHLKFYILYFYNKNIKYKKNNDL